MPPLQNPCDSKRLLVNQRICIEHDERDNDGNDGKRLDQTDGNEGIREEHILRLRLTCQALDEAARDNRVAERRTDCGKTSDEPCADESSCYHNCVFHEKILLKINKHFSFETIVQSSARKISC